MYKLKSYTRMLADRTRRRAYGDALRAAIRPGAVVVEIGTGPGVFALLAARAGARKVYAIELGESIELARQLVAKNGLGDRVELVAGRSTGIDLPERAEVVFSDLRGSLPLLQDHLPSIVDARRRFLAPGGALIPAQDRLWAAVVSAEEVFRDLTLGWDEDELGLDLSPAIRMVRNTPVRRLFGAGQLLVEPRPWATLDYRTVTRPEVEGDLSWTSGRSAAAHGLAVWFDTTLYAPVSDDPIAFSNAPGRAETIYRQTFFPFPHAIAVAAGDRIDVDLEARPGADGRYGWRWRAEVRSGSGGRQKVEQSSLLGARLLEALADRRRLVEAGAS